MFMIHSLKSRQILGLAVFLCSRSFPPKGSIAIDSGACSLCDINPSKKREM